MILGRFEKPREQYNYHLDNLSKVDAALAKGAAKAKLVADIILKLVREKSGY